ncbi:MAG: 50S ribosomal protein L4 [Nanoarchaeota archaeon]
MKLKIKDLKNGESGSMDLPRQFGEEVRPDLITRAVLAIRSHNRQPYGADPEAGMKSSAEVSRRRRKYRGSYGYGISRVPRKILSRRGTRFMWVGAFAPGTIGGRRAHPPKAEKSWDQKINDKERQKAIRSAMAATLDKELVVARGHSVPDAYPFALADDFQNIAKTKDVVAALKTLGFDAELERSRQKSVRAGKGKSRGRKYRRKTGLLLVVDGQCPLELAGTNVPGVDVVKVNELNANLLAPGADLARATLFTEAALKKLDAEKLFLPKLRIFKNIVKISEKSVKNAKKAVAKKEAPAKQKKSASPSTTVSSAKKAEAKTTDK